MQNLMTLGPTPSGRKVTRSEEERKNNNAVSSGHYILPATPKGSARTSLGPFQPDNINNVVKQQNNTNAQ
jgi:hypothetical protein